MCVELGSILDEEFTVLEMCSFGLTSNSCEFSVLATAPAAALSVGSIQIIISITVKFSSRSVQCKIKAILNIKE